jgi:hypothetical protein
MPALAPGRAALAAAATALGLSLAAGCGDAARALGSGAPGPAAALELVDALRARYGPAERDPALQAARPKLAAAALVPSRAFDDKSLWTAGEGEWKSLWLEGNGAPGAYRLVLRASAPAPGEPGAYRARLTLRRLGAERFEWTTQEALVVGRLRPEAIAAAWRALLLAAERDPDPRGNLAAALPRAARALGRLFDLEALTVEKPGDGTARVEVAVRVRPDRIKAESPKLAAYLSRRADGLRMAMTASGSDGRTLWSAEANDTLWRVRLRVREGVLVPLEGAAGGAGGTVRVLIDYSFKAGLFRAGLRGLAADVEASPTGELGFVARLRQQPDWQLPFLVEPLLRGSLRYPFEGAGSEMEVALRTDEGRSELVTESRLRLRESWIVRWLGGFTTKALTELRAAEVEADRYALECLTAVREDLAGLIGATDSSQGRVNPGVFRITAPGHSDVGGQGCGEESAGERKYSQERRWAPADVNVGVRRQQRVR